jgi:seryl-tRNA synthetase
MLDPKRLRSEPEQVAAQLRRRGFVFDLARFQALEARRKKFQVEEQTLQADRNRLAREIGQGKAEKKDVGDLLAQAAQVNEQLAALKTSAEDVEAEFRDFALGLPNVPHASVPDGRDETHNVEVRRWKEPGKLDFAPKDHADLGEALGQMNFAAAAKIAGARFVVLKGELAHLHRALIQFMLNTHTREHGYEEVYVPYIVSADSMQGTGQLPKFESDLFRVEKIVETQITGSIEMKGGRPVEMPVRPSLEGRWYLIPTAEVPVTNLLRDEIVAAEELPRKWVAHTPCFRAEAGAAGKDTKGMIRQHQFEKVELVQATLPGKSYEALEELTAHAEAILKKLDLPYRVVALCTADLGFGAAKTYDIEVWLPSQKRYREISSCSNFEDFQARRMLARYRSGQGKPELLHTLNGSGLAVGRTLVAILENFQDAQGAIAIPSALQPYMGGQTKIG